MDLASFLGIFIGMGLFVWAMAMGGSLQGFLNVPAVMITVGGTFTATLINYPFWQVVSVFRVLRHVFFSRSLKPAEVIAILVRFAEKARREGLLALEDEAAQLNDGFLRKGIQLVVDGTDPELVRNILETELAFLEDRHRAGQGLFETMGALSPAFGMIGTLIGLIQMLGHLDKPETIGPSMATALITTFYGAMMANFLFIPIAGKLRVRSSEETLLKEVEIEGILSIQSGDNPRIVEEKLKAFLAPSMRVPVRREPPPRAGEEG
ncbi:MAG: motility protein A [Acetobacteraceae bacterium]|nr:motility protein A [Acetobacteraceae bacterium]